jgi:hypothetical protein
MRLKYKIIAYCSLLPLVACTPKEKIELTTSHKDNQKVCRLNNVIAKGVEDLYNYNFFSMQKYDSNKIVAWITYNQKDYSPNKVGNNPKIILKLQKNNGAVEDIIFNSTEFHSNLLAYLKKHDDPEAKLATLVNYNFNPTLPTEDIWPDIKNGRSLRLESVAVSFEINELQLEKILLSNNVKLLIETSRAPLVAEIDQDGISEIREFRKKCWKRG